MQQLLKNIPFKHRFRLKPDGEIFTRVCPVEQLSSVCAHLAINLLAVDEEANLYLFNGEEIVTHLPPEIRGIIHG